MKHWKAMSVALAGALVLSLAGTAAVAAPLDDEPATESLANDERAVESPLYTWNGSKYTNTPVPYSPHGDPKQVMIPNVFKDVKEDFRSAWVATIFNLHFGQTSSQKEFIKQYEDVLANFAAYNMNAVIFQVRPEQDAFYPSKLGNPWSKYLTTAGKEGAAPAFNPLEVMVNMTHEAGMEYHAWFNPYRVTNTKVSLLSAHDKAAIEGAGYTVAQTAAATAQEQIKIYKEAGLLAAENFAVAHPEWVLKYDERLFLNPGVPQVKQHVIDTVAEVYEGYAVDAIHFDDYFYPSGFGAANADPKTAADAAQFAAYGQGFPNTRQGLNDWRRSNTDELVESIHTEISTHNTLHGASVQFGISPAGIWNHKANDPLGSFTPTGSNSSYLNLYCDTYKWIKNEWLDYVMPQIYWGFATAAAPYGSLARWWNDVAEGTRVQVYIGQALYRVGSNSVEWTNPQEIPNQLRFNQTLGSVLGTGFYSYNEIVSPAANSVLAKTQTTVKGYWDYAALVPAKDWLSQGVTAPENVIMKDGSLHWRSGDTDTTQFFIVYKGKGAPDDIYRDPRNIIARIYAGGELDFSKAVATSGGSSTQFVVTAVNAAGVESRPVGDSTANGDLYIRRLFGADRYGTNLAVNGSLDHVKGGTVIVATGADFADSLSAAPAAAISDGALYLTSRTTVPAKTLAAIKALKPSKIYIVGGTSAVPNAVSSQLLSATGVSPVRVAGANRYETNARVLQTFFSNQPIDTAFVATGRSYSDSLSASAVAGALGSPVVLIDGTRDKDLPSASAALLTKQGAKEVFVVGGISAVNSTIEKNLAQSFAKVTRLGGADRYATNLAVNELMNDAAPSVPMTGVWIATGRDFPDALSAAPAAGDMSQRLVLSNAKCIYKPVVSQWIKDAGSSVETVTLVGGESVLPKALMSLPECP